MTTGAGAVGGASALASGGGGAITEDAAPQEIFRFTFV